MRKKDGKLRVCMDPRKINEAIKREHFEMPRREDIESELAGAKVFTRLDANSGFYQIPLHDETSRICTVATPFGRYRFLRLPFGISAASEVFQKTLNDIFEALPGTKVYVDDILIWGSSRQEHDERLRQALKAAEKAGLTFNPAKCVVGVTQISFLGDVISAEGIRPNPSLIQAMLQIPEPRDKQAAQRMLGVVNYFGKFIPTLAERTKLLRSIIKKDEVFEWTPNHAEEWRQICHSLSSQPLLAVFDPARETKISCDASRSGVGAALLQNYNGSWKPVAYGSRTLSEAETRYSQIEKETLAITYGCEKFDHFVYGRTVIIETDHHPLIAISKKAIGDMPPRLQRFFMRLLRYNFELNFVPGKKLMLADMLSRAPSSEGSNDVSTDDAEVHAVSTVSSFISEGTWKRLAEETAKDSYLKVVLQKLTTGEPIEGPLKPFLPELSSIRGVLFKGLKVVIPGSMKRETLHRIHEGHLGIAKCKARARRLVFWPGMNSEITAFAERCATCKKYAYSQPKEPLMMRSVPDQPWYRVGIDLFCYGGKSYLCVYDALSNFPEVECLRDTTARTVVDATSAIFARYGIPMEVLTDNGPQFSSSEFASFARTYEFKHITSSPGFPRSNGLSEKGVQVVKRLLKKATEAKQDFWLALLAYRTSPLECGLAPAEILQGRRLRTRLPDYQCGPSHRVVKHSQARSSTQPLTPLHEGDVVRVQCGSWATKARVLKPSTYPRSYHVITQEGRCLRRNRKHLLPTGESFQQDSVPNGNNVEPCSPTAARHVEDIVPHHDPTTAGTLSGPMPDCVPNRSNSSTAARHVEDTVSSNDSATSDSATAGTLSNPTPAPRRSLRMQRPPRRLEYDKDFKQIA